MTSSILIVGKWIWWFKSVQTHEDTLWNITYICKLSMWRGTQGYTSLHKSKQQNICTHLIE